MAMSDKELLSIVDREFTTAMGAEGGEISIERAKALDYYLSKELGNEVDGQSKVVTSDVADVVDGIMPSLLRIFTTADNLLNFDPVGPEDAEKAAQESDYTNYVFFKKNPAFLILYTWFFDALTQKNGIVKAWWDESEEVTTESYENITDDELPALLDDPELEPVERSEDRVNELGETVRDIVFRRVSKGGCARVDNVPPEEYRISQDSRSVDPCGARMVGQEREVTRSDLLSMGFPADVVDSLPAHADTQGRTEEERSRRDKTDETWDSTSDRSQDKVLVREAYIKVDYDGDGRSELRQVFTAGHRVLSNEPIDRQPFHVISPQPLPHKHFGRASAEKVMDIQEVSTTLLRQVLDNLYHTNNPGHAIWEHGIGENTLDDLLTTRVGRVARFERPVGESWAPMTVPFTAGATFPMMEYFEKVKRDRTGISSDSEGLSPDSLKNIQTTVLAQSVDLSKMKVEAVARIFAETGLKSLFLHIHELVMKHQKKVDVVRLRNQWVEVHPQEWRTRLDMTVNIGLGIGTREQNLLHLENIWEKQSQIVQNGGMNLLVKPKHLYATAAELVKNANLKDPGMFFENPGEALSPPQPDEAEELQKMQLEVEQRRQKLDEMRRQVEARKLELDQQEMVLKHQREVAELQEKAESREDKFTVENEKLRNEIAKIQAQVDREREELDLKEKRLDTELEYMRAQALETKARAEKTAAEARALDLETRSAESGYTAYLEDFNEES